MGDHRASVTIEFTFHGKTEKAEWWINWWPWGSAAPGVDQRILDWFHEQTEAGMQRYDEQMEQFWRDENKAATEKAERAELDRLAAKYQLTVNRLE
jgi:hypothetical protein